MTNRVYIFGAGASKDFGMPLGVELFDCAYQLSKLTTRNATVGELHSLLASVEKYLNQIFTNLPEDKLSYPPFEEVMTFLWNCLRSERFDYDKQKLVSIFEHADGARGVFDTFARVLALTLSVAGRAAETSDRLAAFTKYVRAILSESDATVSFISLNYDLLLDDALRDCVQDLIIDDYNYGILLSDVTEPYGLGRSQQFRRRHGLLLLKPHGSLNLVYCSHKQAPYGEGFYYSPTEPIAAVAHTLKCPGCSSRLKPLLIPPLYNKGDFVAASAYKSQRIAWRSTPETYRKHCDHRIQEILGRADEIIVIGYSLPPYDYDFKSLLTTSLMNNPNRETLRLTLITKGHRDAVIALKSQFERLVGAVDIAETNGFYEYLSR
jgi:hypothetical protein